MRSRFLAAIAAVVSALTILAAHWAEPALTPPPAFDSLTHVQGRVVQASPACAGGGRSRPSSFTLSLRMGGAQKALRLLCNDELRSAAVDGSQVELWLQSANWREPGDSSEIWAAAVDGRDVVRYDDAVDFHNRRPQRLRTAYTVAFAIEFVMVFALLHLLRFVLTSARRRR
jgi:hypothetical protein